MDAPSLTVTREGAVRFEVKARPRARTSRLASVRAGTLVVDVAAAPVDGEANAELVAVLAEALRVPRACVEVVRGASARTKLVEVRGLSVDVVRDRLGRSA
jgi:uncharacterized protein